jgi:DNA polymerase-3 subunit epsilon
MSLPVLPTYYYLDHFAEMLSFVEETYGAVLGPEHHGFTRQFRTLAMDEQCLFVRMLNRRGYIFDPGTLRYAEISDLGLALQNLMSGGFLRRLDASDYGAWLCILKKDALIEIARSAGRTDVRTSWSKPKLIDYFTEHVPSVAAEHSLADDYVAMASTRPVEFLLYLYFGKTNDDLKSFALRDLGIVRVNDAASFKARFEDANEARACFHYSQVIDQLAVPSARVYAEAARAVLEGPSDGGSYAMSLRDKAAYEIALFFEKQKDHAQAIELYRFASSPECNERLARLLYATGCKEEAQALLQGMIDDPGSDEEYIFASDFYARKFGGRRTSACTELLRAGRTMVVDESYRGSPEAGVAGVLRREGWTVYHTENLLWHNLFGSLFWEELFESGQLHSGFDWLPHCLKNKTFALLFEQEIQAKLAMVRQGAALKHLLKTIAGYWGRPNGIFSWSYIDVDALRDLLACGNPNAIASVLELMCRDFDALRDGFPDVMLIKDGSLRFMEIKAEGDVVRRNQLTRLRQLDTAGLQAEICRVDYRFDPDQDYVVIDIETTGGWGASDRITEIGAIKMRNHQVIDEWHTLINPQRSIPVRITQLTGITNEMVWDAPVFAEIADSLMAFMGDGIFVAHNVNFDYGFISKEYERLERKFRFPKLCTCAGMRRYYPGNASYSLGRICAIYEVPLENHHRALCDAKAASKLLNLINKRREDRFLRKAA